MNNSFFDVSAMLVFGVVGYVFKKLSYPLAPLVLALVLGGLAESSFRQSMLLSNGSLSIFWSNPLLAGIVGLAMLMLLWPLIPPVLGAAVRRARPRVADRPPGDAAGPAAGRAGRS